ncbi:MAG: erythromycin esterase family protein [bacterium]
MKLAHHHTKAAAVCMAALLLACSGDQSTGVGPPAPTAPDLTPGTPIGWYGSPSPSYAVGLDKTHRHGGTASAYITGGGTGSTSFVMVQDFLADTYRGKRVRWSAWVQHDNIVGSDVGLVMSVEGAGQITGYDDMKHRSLAGTADWHQVSIVLDVPMNTVGIEPGVIMTGTGTFRIDDAHLDIVGLDVPSTNTLTAPRLTQEDSSALAHVYGLGGSAPTNLDFEGVAAAPQTAVDWLNLTAQPLVTTDPLAALADLQPLSPMIGSARLVGLGEDTHGTREFFQMKHRILQMLVRDKGFTIFAIEATTPEANDLNRYVLGGDGDPKALLSRLYFWTWNTQEVLDMITWIRQWNGSVQPSRRVQFLGFDMQFAGAAMDSVQAFAASVNRADSAFVAARFACMNPFRNRGSQQSDLYVTFYAAQAPSAQAACRTGLQDVYDLIARDITLFPNAASNVTYQLRLHDARLVQQFEQQAAVGGVTSGQRRDQFMAENVGWIRDQAAPGTGIVLWAHNGHIQSRTGYMGGYLRAAYGTDYVNLGFLFADGELNAVGLNGEGLKSWHASFVPPNSVEAIFSRTGKPALLLDARLIPSGGSAASALAGPLPMRSIGAAFNPNSEASFFGPVNLPAIFDLLVYIQNTKASTLLPFIH